MRHVLLATSLLSLVIACAKECPELDCNAGLGIELRRNGWVQGHYTLHIDYADVELWCLFAVPEESASLDEDAGSEASQPDAGTSSAPRCLQTSGDPVETSFQVGRNVVLQLVDEPESLRIRVTRDGTSLKDVRVQPEYGKRRVDGCPACPFVLVPVVLP